MSSSSRIYGLDILRALAIILVVVSHSKPILLNFVSSDYEVYLRHLGLFGVEIFFVLSGFLIGTILIKNILYENFTKKSLYNFWIKRWFRTVPLYIFFIIVNLILYFHLHGTLEANFLYFFLFLQNLFSPPPPFMPEAWSLAVEEWFYIVTPLTLFISLRIFENRISKDKIIFFTILFLLLLITLNRWYQIELYNLELGQMIRKVVVLRLDALLYGVLLAFLFIKYQDFFYKYQNLLFFLGLAIFSYYYFGLMFGIHLTPKVKSFFFTFIDLSFALMLVRFYFIKRESSSFSFMSFIALISYSIYLVHLILIDLILKNMPISNSFDAFNSFFLLITLIIAISTITYRFIELPFLNLRERYLK